MRTTLLTLLVSVSSALAQPPVVGDSTIIDQNPVAGVRAPVQWFAESALTSRCPAFVVDDGLTPDAMRSAAPGSQSNRSWCVVDTSYVLPNADGTRWMAAVYSRSSEYPASPAMRERVGKTRDTVVIVTTVLYTWRDHALSWSPEWVGTVSYDYIRSVRIASAARPGSMLASFVYCVNGTGGCWQRYLQRRNGKWTPVVEAFWAQIPPIPDGRIGKGAGIDARTLSGSYGVYGGLDGNCCPSRELVLQLELRGDSLVLGSHSIRPRDGGR